MFKTLFRLIVLVIVGSLIFTSIYLMRKNHEKQFVHFEKPQIDIAFDYPAKWGRPKIETVGTSYRITFPQDQNLISIQKMKALVPLTALSQFEEKAKELPLPGSEQAFIIENSADKQVEYILLAQRNGHQYIFQLTSTDAVEGKNLFDSVLQGFEIK